MFRKLALAVLCCGPLAAQPAGRTRVASLTLFGKTWHVVLDMGALGVAIILTLAILCTISVVLAVVARRRAKEVAKLNAGLERRVAERTEQLKETNQQLEAFSYSVSHDLKAPLRAISGFSRILLEDYGATLDGEAQRHLHSIARGAETMGQLIEDLLEFSRQARKEMIPSSINMGEMAASVFEELRCGGSEHKLECRLRPLPSARGDRAMIRQIWVNLLSNAIKFTERKGNALVEVGCSESGPDVNTYYVKDNGAGFDMRYADKLFGVFQRLHSGNEFEGTGVGLAIVQRVVQRHGGRVWAEGIVDGGATFHFTLPAEGNGNASR